MPLHGSAPGLGWKTKICSRLLFLTIVLSAVTAAAQDGAWKINENWNFVKIDNRAFVSPRQVQLIGVRSKDYSAAEIAVIRKKGVFHLGRARDNPEYSRFFIIGIPRPICRNKPGLSNVLILQAWLEIIVDGRRFNPIELSARCGNPAIAEEVDLGSKAFTLITTAFRRGRTAEAWVVAGNQRIVGYKFSLTGFTQAAGVLQRNGR